MYYRVRKRASEKDKKENFVSKMLILPKVVSSVSFRCLSSLSAFNSSRLDRPPDCFSMPEVCKEEIFE